MHSESPDFSRNIRCILGLPFDVIDLPGAARRLGQAMASGRQCVLVTPNVNFAMAAKADREYRAAVWQADLSIADGWPLVWIGKTCGLPFPQRVAGSSLFEYLREHDTAGLGRRVGVYFFGGQDGVGQQACRALNEQSGKLAGCGAMAPGFGDLADMSTPEVLQAINHSSADFVVVSIGARRGTLWIERNRHQLKARVLAGLGAVVNFTAGTVRRAPAVFQRLGLEWLWRILQEPALWRRYWSDGTGLIQVVLLRVLPAELRRRWARPPARTVGPALALVDCAPGSVVTLTLTGHFEGAELGNLREALAAAAALRQPVCIDLEACAMLDNQAVALLGLLHGHCARHGLAWQVKGAAPGVAQAFIGCFAGFLLQALP